MESTSFLKSFLNSKNFNILILITITNKLMSVRRVSFYSVVFQVVTSIISFTRFPLQMIV